MTEAEKLLLRCESQVDQYEACLAEAVSQLGPAGILAFDKLCTELSGMIDRRHFATALVTAVGAGPMSSAVFSYGAVTAVRRALVAAARQEIEREQERENP